MSIPASRDFGSRCGAWVIDFAPKTEMYAKANEAGLLLRELARLGETQVTLDDSDLPPLDQIAAESAYLRWTIRLTTRGSILPPRSPTKSACSMISSRW